MRIRNKALRRFWTSEGRIRTGLDARMLAKLRLLLTVLDQSPGPEGLRGNPRWMLHPLKGDMDGFWSARVTGNWRLVFRFENHEAVDVDLIDYH